MSDNEHALAVLGDTEILAVKHLPLQVVPQLIQRGEDSAERAPLMVSEKASDVLKKQKPWLFRPSNPRDLKKENATGIAESRAHAGNGEGLAGETAAQEIEVGETAGVDTGDVAEGPVVGKPSPVEGGGVLVDFREADTDGAASDTEFKSADAAEQREIPRSCVIHRLLRIEGALDVGSTPPGVAVRHVAAAIVVLRPAQRRSADHIFAMKAWRTARQGDVVCRHRIVVRARLIFGEP